MKLHANAALSLKQRERMVLRVLERGWSLTQAAEAAEVSDRTCSKWVARYRQEGAAGLLDRSSAPVTVANRTDEATVQLLAALRRLRFTAPELADLLDLPASTISGLLKRIGMGKLGRLGQELPQRYERSRHRALVHIHVQIVGPIACRALGVRHLRTRPYRPQTDGQAERFIRTLLGGWAYSGAVYASSAERTAALDGWLHHYNHHRRHQALGRQTPITRLNNLLGSYT